ncbi:leucine-rich repeat-containing protein 74B isoform X4 [Numida meleagris]|uniref:leucine-rich repeat-containing protein 74B isoform X4 n=1 Tax=Numida meleagris TaxID=8996 RepID=UPI000B3E3809|nr:leucine-rich repeat-containing protein 74B isoform X4 [Numida meleagris]
MATARGPEMAAGGGAEDGSSAFCFSPAEREDGPGPVRSSYLAACRACGVRPASCLLPGPRGPALLLRHRGLGTRGAKALALSLMANTSVVSLDLADNWLLGEGAAAIAEMLKENGYISENTTVVALQLSGNEFDDQAAKYLADAITANSKVEILDLSYNKFGDKAGEVLGVAIAENIGLKELKMGWNHFHSEGAVALAKGVGANVFLKVLDVSYNGFGNSGAAALGEALRANNVLEELNVSNNRISVEGALRLADGLKENKTLRILQMMRNPMQNEGCCGILKALRANSGTGMEVLDLPDVPVSKELAELREAVKALLPNLLLRHGGNTKQQRKSLSAVEPWPQPKALAPWPCEELMLPRVKTPS